MSQPNILKSCYLVDIIVVVLKYLLFLLLLLYCEQGVNLRYVDITLYLWESLCGGVQSPFTV